MDVNAVAPYCKPMPESFQIAMRMAGESDPSRCVMIDDLPHTTRAARQLGMLGLEGVGDVLEEDQPEDDVGSVLKMDFGERQKPCDPL